MGFGFSLEQRLAPRLELRHELRLTAEQRYELRHVLAHRLLLLAQEIHGYSYVERADCPACDHRLTSREILEGFLPSPTDTTTGCPRCKCRFQPVLVASAEHGTKIEVHFLCPDQAIHALKGLEHCTPEAIQHDTPSAYQSALVHFGSLRAAFAQLGITYTLEDLHGWKTKVIPYLGQLPDTTIAGIVGVSPATIGRLRRHSGIPRFRISDHV